MLQKLEFVYLTEEMREAKKRGKKQLTEHLHQLVVR